MRIQIVSDLHLECAHPRFHWDIFNPKEVVGDVLVIAGDLCNATLEGIHPFLAHIKVPVIWVIGNHEHYTGCFFETIEIAKRVMADLPHVHILDKERLELADCTILGGSLWTDFDGGRAIPAALSGMNDFRLIKNISFSANTAALSPAMVQEDYSNMVQFLEEELGKKNKKPVVVVTHHAPSLKSRNSARSGSALDHAYCCNLDKMIMRYQPVLWVHGHTHRSESYNIGDTSVVSNPLGYCWEPNQSFRGDLVVKV